MIKKNRSVKIDKEFVAFWYFYASSFDNDVLSTCAIGNCYATDEKILSLFCIQPISLAFA